MEFKEAQLVVVSGTPGSIRHLMQYLPVYFYHSGKKVLVFDTINSINPHHKFYQGEYQQQYFDNTYCVRTPMPYDLWARLKTSESFIKRNKIGVVLISSLSLLFRGVVIRETDALVKNILKTLNAFTTTHNLITVIGNSTHEDKSVILASNHITHQDNCVEVEF